MIRIHYSKLTGEYDVCLHDDKSGKMNHHINISWLTPTYAHGLLEKIRNNINDREYINRICLLNSNSERISVRIISEWVMMNKCSEIKLYELQKIKGE
jgi:hypothetical protein